MLVLTRKANETIVIADQIEVTVLSTDGIKVRIGITAPRQIPVVRSELLDRDHPNTGRLLRQAA
jgi:carbon storage regulator